MKHLKLFEGDYLDYLDDLTQKAEYYQENYTDKYVVIKYNDNLYLSKFISIALNGYYAKIENYDWDAMYQAYNVDSVDALNLGDFEILAAFDTLKEAEKSYEMMLDGNKYNV